MEPYTLRTLDIPAVKTLYEAHMLADFPADERPPLKGLIRQVESGFLTAQVMTDGKKDYAYVLAAVYQDYVLYTHLAVYPEHRSGGFGSKLLSLLHQAYATRRVELVEVENPAVAKDEDDRTLQERRIAFYERAGYRLVPHIHYVLFGVDMLLMTHTREGAGTPLPQEVGDTLRALYFTQLPEKDRHHFSLTITA